MLSGSTSEPSPGLHRRISTPKRRASELLRSVLRSSAPSAARCPRRWVWSDAMRGATCRPQPGSGCSSGSHSHPFLRGGGRGSFDRRDRETRGHLDSRDPAPPRGAGRAGLDRRRRLRPPRSAPPLVYGRGGRTSMKPLTEVALLLEALHQINAREGSIRHGHPATNPRQCVAEIPDRSREGGKPKPDQAVSFGKPEESTMRRSEADPMGAKS